MVDQDVDELSGGNFALKDLELATGYKDQIQTNGVSQSQRLRGMYDTDKHI